MNKTIISMKKNIFEYKAVILDVDGTLYSQPWLRFHMAVNLAFYYLRHPLRAKELIILKKYRWAREHWQRLNPEESAPSSLEDSQYQYVGRLLNVPPEQVKRTVRFWIHSKPLALLPKCKDTELAGLIKRLQEHSAVIAIYSDYPAEDKVRALNIKADFIFCSSDTDINCMKPDPKAMKVILHKMNAASKDTLMIGDRFSKDGMAAKNTDMDYVILGKSMSARYKLYHNSDLFR